MPMFSQPPLLLQRRPTVLPGTSAVTSSAAGSASGTSTAQAFAPFGAGAAAGTSTVSAVGASLVAATGTAAGTSTAVGTSNNAFPLSVSADGRYLKQNDGTPFLICAQTTWSLAVDIPLAGISSFLSTITGQGFNAVMMNAIEHHYTVVKPPKERGGNLPFTQRLDGTTYTGSPNGTTGASGTQGQFTSDNYSSISTQSPDPTFINNTYWQAVETILNACLSSNVLVFVWPAYLGFHAGDEGWMQEMVQWDAVTGAGGFTGQSFADPTKSKMWNYGAWLAARWKSYPNIIWVAGGDYGANTQTLSTQERAAVTNFVAGMKSVSGQASVLWTAHWERPCLATDTTISGVTWDLNLAYADNAVAEVTRRGYAVSPTIPTFLGEYFYEDDVFGGSAPYRRYLYWGFLGGIAGGFFGHEQLWRFDDGTPGTDYTTLLATQATLDASRQFAFWKSRPWHRLRPSGLNSIGTLITAGGGTASPQGTDYVAAAATPEGDLLLAYVPPAHTGSVTVDMTKVSATVQARWFDPTNAAFTTIGAFNNTSTHAFTTPGNNNAGDADWLLLLETIAASASGTSTATAVGSSLAAATGSASGTSTATAGGQSIVAATGTATGSSTATAVSTTTINGTGSSTGSSTAAATGSSLATGVGSTTGSSTVTATGQSTADAAGNAAGVGTATSVGISTADSTGTSSGAGTAAAVGVAFAASSGTSAGSSSVTGTGSSLASGTGSSVGSSTVSAAGVSVAEGVGSTAGVSTVAAVGQSIAGSSGTSTGSGTATGAGNALVPGVGSASGTSTALAEGVGVSAGSGTGLATGTATVSGVGISIAVAAGSSAGGATANGAGASLVVAVGSSSGSSTASAVSLSSGSSGTASGVATAQAVGASLASSIGSSFGTCVVSGVGGMVTGAAAGTAAGTSTAVGFGVSLAAATGTAAGTSTALGSSTLNKPAFQAPVIRGVRPVPTTLTVRLRRRH